MFDKEMFTPEERAWIKDEIKIDLDRQEFTQEVMNNIWWGAIDIECDEAELEDERYADVDTDADDFVPEETDRIKMACRIVDKTNAKCTI